MAAKGFIWTLGVEAALPAIESGKMLWVCALWGGCEKMKDGPYLEGGIWLFWVSALDPRRHTCLAPPPPILKEAREGWQS